MVRIPGPPEQGRVALRGGGVIQPPAGLPITDVIVQAGEIVNQTVQRIQTARRVSQIDSHSASLYEDLGLEAVAIEEAQDPGAEIERLPGRIQGVIQRRLDSIDDPVVRAAVAQRGAELRASHVPSLRRRLMDREIQVQQGQLATNLERLTKASDVAPNAFVRQQIQEQGLLDIANREAARILTGEEAVRVRGAFEDALRTSDFNRASKMLRENPSALKEMVVDPKVWPNLSEAQRTSLQFSAENRLQELMNETWARDQRLDQLHDERVAETRYQNDTLAWDLYLDGELTPERLDEIRLDLSRETYISLRRDMAEPAKEDKTEAVSRFYQELDSGKAPEQLMRDAHALLHSKQIRSETFLRMREEVTQGPPVLNRVAKEIRTQLRAPAVANLTQTRASEDAVQRAMDEYWLRVRNRPELAEDPKRLNDLRDELVTRYSWLDRVQKAEPLPRGYIGPREELTLEKISSIGKDASTQRINGEISEDEYTAWMTELNKWRSIKEKEATDAMKAPKP